MPVYFFLGHGKVPWVCTESFLVLLQPANINPGARKYFLERMVSIFLIGGAEIINAAWKAECFFKVLNNFCNIRDAAPVKQLHHCHRKKLGRKSRLRP